MDSLFRGRQKNSRIRKARGHFESQGSKFQGGIRRLLEIKRRNKKLWSPSVTLDSTDWGRRAKTPQAATKLRKETALVVYIL